MFNAYKGSRVVEVDSAMSNSVNVFNADETVHLEMVTIVKFYVTSIFPE